MSRVSVVRINHGLGSIYATGTSPMKTAAVYPWFNKFSDEGGKVIKGT